MEWLYFLLGLFLLIVALLFCPLWIYVSYESDKETDPLGVWIIFLAHFKVYPKKQSEESKTEPSKPEHPPENPSGIEPTSKPVQPPSASQEKGKKVANPSAGNKPGALKEKQSPEEILSTILSLLRVVGKRGPRLLGRMKLKVSNLDVTFAKEDPAETALFYGELMAVINGLSAALSSFFKVGYQKVSLRPDFEAEEPYSKCNVQFGLSAPLWSMLSFLLGGGIQFLRETATEKDKTNQESTPIKSKN